jgi:chromosome segregation protein
MYLKALSVKGFKSFADPAVLQFEPGVTVVVGPNGSGKSNVVDAVAWVLGAQGPRMLRSSKMEDVIFAGSADRPALGRAEVSLTIDNRAGHLPGGLAEITITRTLFRSGDSEYALNGQPCRLLDIQELLSDSGVGRQQHVIMSQGQLDQILNARPEDRRAVVEEAAGVLKHRRRRERSERRLAAADENLERLADLMREVRRQIRPLERQAAAARSHATLAEELRALRLHLVGRELAGLDGRRTTAATECASLAEVEAGLRRRLAELEAASDDATAELATRRDDALVAALTRVQGLVERARGLAGIVGERGRSVARSLDEAADVDVVSTLESEGARLGAELAAGRDAEAAIGADTERLAQLQLGLEVDGADHDAAFGDVDDLRRAEERAASATIRAGSLREALERDGANLARFDEQVELAAPRRAAVAAEATALDAELRGLALRLPALQGQARAAAAAAAAGTRGAAEADEVRRRTEGERHRSEARAEALERALAQARGSSSAEALRGVPGVIGRLADLVDVDDGWGAAFESAVGAAVAAAVVEGSHALRRAMSRLEERQTVGALLPLLTGTAGTAGTAPAEGLARAVQDAARRGAQPVRPRVRGHLPAVEAVLDRLLAGAVVAPGRTDAVDLALDWPELVVVTHHGDRFSASGWQVASSEGGGPAAALEARRAAAAAVAAAMAAAEAAARAGRQAATLSATAAEADRQAERAEDRRQTVIEARRGLEAQMTSLGEEVEASARLRLELAERIERERTTLAVVEGTLPALAAAAASAGVRLEEADVAARALADRRAELTLMRHDLELRQASFTERRTVLTDRLRDVERRLAGHEAQRQEAAARRERLESDGRALERLAAVVARQGARLEELAHRLRSRREQQLDALRSGGERLEALRRQRGDAETSLGATRDRLRVVELEQSEASVRYEAAVEALERELGCTAAEARAATCPELAEGVSAPVRAAALEQELAALGPVNPLALEELSALEERQQFLEGQVADVRQARRQLLEVIRAVDDEIARIFVAAFADVNEHFQALVASLFPGGTGRLTLTDPEDLLGTGIEVEARPAGKNVRKLALLSGGERSLVALAFLFAVFRSRPSPFYLMDEVEAALDDVNLHRFLDLLHEFRDEAQLIIVSHQKRTMEAADALYGVTMQAGGSSKVVSQKVRRGEASDAEAAATAS